MGRTETRLGALSAPEVAAALGRRAVLLLPCGSQESHGPALPMGDYLACESIAEQIAARAGEAGTECLVAPVLPFGGADYFGGVPGGIALSQATLRAVLGDVLGCLLRHGADRLIVVNGHGGNCRAIHEVTLGLRRERGVTIPSLYLWRMARALMDAHGMAAGRAGHGADPLASIAMHLFGGAAAAGPASPAREVLGLEVVDWGTGEFGGAPIDLPLDMDDYAPSGVAPGADASRANAADGRVLSERLVEIGAAFVCHYAAQG